MKKISIYMLSLIICLICLLPINVSGYTYPDNYKWEYSHDKGSSDYYNVNIDNIYYDIAIYDDILVTPSGSKGTYYVYVRFAKTKGDTLKFPETIFFKGRNFKVKEIGIGDGYAAAPYGKWKMPYKNVIIPNSVESADFQYAKFTKIEKIFVPKKTQVLGGLSDYPKLKVIIDKNNPYIKMKNGAVYSKNGKKLLSLVNSKKTYKVSKGTKKIDFFGVKKLEKVYLPASLKTITFNAFGRCRNLKTVKINNKTQKIGICAFEKCTSLERIDLPKNLEGIGYSAFMDCYALKEFVIPKKVKKIKFWTFKNCAELSRVKIESQERSPKIEDTAFENTAEGIEFIVKNQKVANQLKEQLSQNKKGVKKAKILIGDKVVYDNINCKSKKFQKAYDIITTQNGIKYRFFNDGDSFNNTIQNDIIDIFLKSKKIEIPNTVSYRNKIYKIDSVKFDDYVNPKSAKTCEKLIADDFDALINIHKWNSLKEIKATNIKYLFENIVSCDELKKMYVSGTSDCECFISNISQNKHLKNITLKNIDVIANESINECKNLKTIILSGKVGYIQKKAICKCDNLKVIKIQTKNKIQMQKKAFIDVPESCKIYVKNKAMKKAVEKAGFKGKVIIMK